MSVIVSKNKWFMTDVEQMIGRGCRFMGKAYSNLFSLMKNENDRINGINVLKNELINRENFHPLVLIKLHV